MLHASEKKKNHKETCSIFVFSNAEKQSLQIKYFNILLSNYMKQDFYSISLT